MTFFFFCCAVATAEIYLLLGHIHNKQIKKGEKNVLHTLHRAPKYTGFFADFRDLYIFEKSLDFCDFLIYYSVRYSGIVQSVEQRTVNFLDSILLYLDKPV